MDNTQTNLSNTNNTHGVRPKATDLIWHTYGETYNITYGEVWELKK